MNPRNKKLDDHHPRLELDTTPSISFRTVDGSFPRALTKAVTSDGGLTVSYETKTTSVLDT